MRNNHAKDKQARSGANELLYVVIKLSPLMKLK